MNLVGDRYTFGCLAIPSVQCASKMRIQKTLAFFLSTTHKYTSFRGPRGSPRAHVGIQRGDLRSDLPFDFFEISPTNQKTATACAIAVLICNIKPAVPCEREDRNPALARWCPLFCFVLPTSSKPVKGAVVREVCIPQNEVRAPSICCGSTKSPITNTAG